MSDYIRRILPVVICFLFLLAAASPTEASNPRETGGTNFAVYDLSLYGTNPTEENYSTVNFVIANFDKNPSLINSRLQDMCNAGQQKIALVIWFFPYAADTASVNSITGRPSAKIENNLRQLLPLVAGQKNNRQNPCFNEIQFRFAGIGSADPNLWMAWNEERYQQNKSFIWNTRQIVNEAMSGQPQKLIFDLGVELGGRTEGQNPRYTESLWREYTSEFGTTDTYGFSIAWSPGRFNNLHGIYSSVSKHPSQHAVDIYDITGTNTGTQLEQIANEMQSKGELNKPLIIQETYFTDSGTFSQIQSTTRLGLTIHTIMQWQVTKSQFLRPDGQFRHFSTVSSAYIYYSDNPAGLTHACNSTGTSAQLSWDKFSAGTTVMLRVDQTNNNATTCAHSWLCEGSTDLLLNDLAVDSYDVTILPGVRYNWWIQTKTIAGSVSAAASQQFTCTSSTPASPPPTAIPGLPAVAGDLTGDGHVDLADYNKLVAGFGTTYTLADYNSLVANFGK